MQEKTSSRHTDRKNPSYGLGCLLFSEDLIFRWLRISGMLAIILGWGVTGTLIFEMAQDGFTALNIVRYALAPLSAIIGVLFLGARYLQDVYELPGFTSALRHLFATMFDGPPHSYLLFSGHLLPSLNISSGKADTSDADAHILQRIGGPGWLSVEKGNVVLLEYLHGPAKVLGPGFHFIRRLLHVQEIFLLEDQQWEASPIVATTKDGIEVAVYDFQFGFRLASHLRGNTVKKRTDIDPYPFSAKSVWQLAYNRTVAGDGTKSDWGKWVQSKLDGAITGFINKQSIDEIMSPTSGHVREKVLSDVSSPELRKSIMDGYGTEITWLNIGRFDVYDEKIRNGIMNYRLKAWLTQWAGKASLIRAQGKAEQIAQTESGRIEKTTSMLRSILQALGDVKLEGDVNEHVWNIVLARTAQIIEAMTSQYGIEILDLDSVDHKKEVL